METKREKKITWKGVWKLCPVRLVLLIISLLWIGFYFLTRDNKQLMNAISRIAVRPWHRGMGTLTAKVPFSLAEWIILLAVLTVLAFIAQLIIHIVRHRGGTALFRWAVTFLMVVALAFGLFSLWWGVFYYSDSFSEQAGLTDREISNEELAAVTEYFGSIANQYSVTVQRDKNGSYAVPRKSLFDRSADLYKGAEKQFPCLCAPPLRAKPVVFSKYMSWINYTGFFFPYTAEANLNVDCPTCLLGSTIAHELAHQRGVAREDEANFVGIMACMESGDPDFIYSAALLAYVYLGNELYTVDYNAWQTVYASLNGLVLQDLRDNNNYWKQYETKAADVSEKVYEVFLQTYGDDRGMRCYDACVDLLVIWYLDEATA